MITAEFIEGYSFYFSTLINKDDIKVKLELGFERRKEVNRGIRW